MKKIILFLSLSLALCLNMASPSHALNRNLMVELTFLCSPLVQGSEVPTCFASSDRNIDPTEEQATPMTADIANAFDFHLGKKLRCMTYAFHRTLKSGEKEWLVYGLSSCKRMD